MAYDETIFCDKEHGAGEGASGDAVVEQTVHSSQLFGGETHLFGRGFTKEHGLVSYGSSGIT